MSIIDGYDICGCDDSLAARQELARVKAERDYLLQFADPKEIAQMRRELAAEWEAQQGWPAMPEDLGPIG